LLNTFALLIWLSLPALIGAFRRLTRDTSLASVVYCLSAAWGLWCVTLVATIWEWIPSVALDLLWYFIAVVALLPPIAVLGARRPINRVWHWFVLLPLLLVLGWPVVSALATGRLPREWNLEEPMLVGFLLVLVMGGGNYLGLRFTLPALGLIVAEILIAAPLGPSASRWLPAPPPARYAATLLAGCSAWLAFGLARMARRASRDSTPVVRIWEDFRELFGIVWARRVQERLNDMLQRDNAPLRLTLHGFEPVDRHGNIESIADENATRSAQAALVWLLQKFVDREWLNARGATAADFPNGLTDHRPSSPHHNATGE
jgi:hypothetical protein